MNKKNCLKLKNPTEAPVIVIGQKPRQKMCNSAKKCFHQNKINNNSEEAPVIITALHSRAVSLWFIHSLQQ